LFHQYRLDGALMLGALPGLPDEEILGLGRRGIPLVLIGRTVGAGGTSAVTADNRLGGCLSASHLCDLGHRRIAVMRGPRGWPDFPQRLDGFRREISRRAPGTIEIRFYPCRSRKAEAGYEATMELLKKERPTALVCLNDATAMGSIRAISDRGLRVPRDISVIGFDDDELAAYFDPPLTTIRQPRLEMGARGVEELLAAMRGKSNAPVTTTVLDVSLVVRSSTCPPA
jgi:LacI family transcriptional regulator